MQLYYKTQTTYCFSANCSTNGHSLDVIEIVTKLERTDKRNGILKCVELIGDILCQTNPDDKGYQITRAFTILFAKGKLQGIKAYNALLDKYPGDKSILEIKDQFYDFDRKRYLESLWPVQ